MSPTIEPQFPLDKVADAFRYQESGGHMKDRAEALQVGVAGQRIVQEYARPLCPYP